MQLHECMDTGTTGRRMPAPKDNAQLNVDTTLVEDRRIMPYKPTRALHTAAVGDSTPYKIGDLDVICDRESTLPEGPWAIRENGPFEVSLVYNGTVLCTISSEKREMAFDIANYINNARSTIPKLCVSLAKKFRKEEEHAADQDK